MAGELGLGEINFTSVFMGIDDMPVYRHSEPYSVDQRINIFAPVA
ncbi:hypothetical protein AAD001_06120 [Colwelliaceae bacterium 6471]